MTSNATIIARPDAIANVSIIDIMNFRPEEELSDLTDEQLLGHYQEACEFYKEIMETIPMTTNWQEQQILEAANEMMDGIHKHFWYRPAMFGYAAWTAPDLTLQVVSVNDRQELMLRLESSSLSVDDGYANPKLIGNVYWDESPMGAWDGQVHYVHQGRIEAPPAYAPRCRADGCDNIRDGEHGELCQECFLQCQTQVKSPRLQKAEKIVNSLKFYGENHFGYQGSDSKPYQIHVGSDIDTCTCLDRKYNTMQCKHILAAKLHPQFQEVIEVMDFDEMMEFID